MNRRNFLKNSIGMAAGIISLPLLNIGSFVKPSHAFGAGNYLMVFSGIQKGLFKNDLVRKYETLMDICIEKDIPSVFVHYDKGKNIPRSLFRKLIEIPRVEFFPNYPKQFNSIPKSGKTNTRVVSNVLSALMVSHPGSLERKIDFDQLIVVGENINLFDQNSNLPFDSITCSELSHERCNNFSLTDNSFETIIDLLKQHKNQSIPDSYEKLFHNEKWGVAIIDMQEPFLDNDISHNQRSELIKNITSVLKYAQANNFPILNFENEEEGVVINELKPFVNPDFTYRRIDRNGFIRLKKQDVPEVDKLFVMGVYADDCVTETIKGAHLLGMETATCKEVIRGRYFKSLFTLQTLPEYTQYSTTLTSFL